MAVRSITQGHDALKASKSLSKLDNQEKTARGNFELAANLESVKNKRLANFKKPVEGL